MGTFEARQRSGLPEAAVDSVDTAHSASSRGQRLRHTPMGGSLAPSRVPIVPGSSGGRSLASVGRRPSAVYTVRPPVRASTTRSSPPDSFGFATIPGYERSERSDLIVQPSLRLGAPASPLEREADAIAERIVRAEPAAGAPPSASGPGVQRSCCTDCAAQEEHQGAGKRAEFDGEVLGKFTAAVGRMTPATGARIRSLFGQGVPLPDSERAFFEPRLGHPLGGVRIHTSPEAGEAARAISARAFTHRTDVAFAPGEYAPWTSAGRRLLAHELVHVVQQSGLTGPPVQRDLATPPPATPPAAQAVLTHGQVLAALAFNRARYDPVRTRLIQDLVGSTPTGIWTEDDIVLIGELQESYGLTKDGMVGPVTFRFLDAEVRREGISHADAHCLLAFQVRNFGVADAGHVGGHRNIQGHFEVDARFSRTCGCAHYQYRQFIRGHAIRRPAAGGPPVNLGLMFRIPGGGLPAAFVEDGDVTDPIVNYGHRADPAEAAPVNRYVDDGGADDQAAGCHYQNSDFPGGPLPFTPGDALDIDINFRGEIQRDGRVVQTKFWSGIRGVFT